MIEAKYINKGFKPRLPGIDSKTRRLMESVGVQFPDSRHELPRAVPVHSAYKGLSTAIWLPDIEVELPELPVIAVALADDRKNIQLRKIEAYFVGMVPRVVAIDTTLNETPDMLLNFAQSRLTEEASVSLDAHGSPRVNNDDHRQLLSYFPVDRFYEYVGIDLVQGDI